MRIVVSGTHASGKSTLISDFALRHPDFTVLPDPFDLMDESLDSPSTGMFSAQLRIAADRLSTDEFPGNVIAERGPLDFLAYLLALEDVRGAATSSELIQRSTTVTTEALTRVDLLVVLPLNARDAVATKLDEHQQLRVAMNGVLLDLIEDRDLIGARTKLVEVVGDREERLSILESLL